jgi:hypothetical protein
MIRRSSNVKEYMMKKILNNIPNGVACRGGGTNTKSVEVSQNQVKVGSNE